MDTALQRQLLKAFPGADPEGVVEFARYIYRRQVEARKDAVAQVRDAFGSLPVDRTRCAREQRRLKRRLQRANPTGWREEWRQQRAAMKGFPRGERGKRGRPKRAAFWATVWLLRAFFHVMTRKPQMLLIAQVLNACDPAAQWTKAKLESGWAKRQQDFEPWHPEAFLFGECNHAVGVMLSDGDWGSASFECVVIQLHQRLSIRVHILELLRTRPLAEDEIVKFFHPESAMRWLGGRRRESSRRERARARRAPSAVVRMEIGTLEAEGVVRGFLKDDAQWWEYVGKF